MYSRDVEGVKYRNILIFKTWDLRPCDYCNVVSQNDDDDVDGMMMLMTMAFWFCDCCRFCAIFVQLCVYLIVGC